jgi:NitT/TauT family transport system permease protein
LRPEGRGGNPLWNAAAVFFWLLVWQLASLVVGMEILLPSPASVLLRLGALARAPEYWSAVGFSLARITLGFLSAFCAGTALAALARAYPPVGRLLAPLMGAMKAAPVVSYIILCLLLMPASRLSAAVSFMMALPILYTNVLTGLFAVDARLLEMAAVFDVPKGRRALFIVFPQTAPFLLSGVRLALGLCWKAGVAAEVIGLPRGSVGEGMYQAKIFVDSGSVLAWTVTVIALSFALEQIGTGGIAALLRALEKA